MGKEIDHEYTLAELLRRPDVSYAGLMSLAGGRHASPELARQDSAAAEGPDAVAQAADAERALFSAVVTEQVEIVAKYAGYIDRQRVEIERAAHFESLRLPEDLDYMRVPALGFEAGQILSRQRPETLGLASRLSGITPAAIALLLVHLRKGRSRKPEPAESETGATADRAGA